MDGMRTGAVLMEGMRSLEKNGSRNFRELAILAKKMDLTVLFVSQAPLHKKAKFSIRDFCSKCDQVHRILWIW